MLSVPSYQLTAQTPFVFSATTDCRFSLLLVYTNPFAHTLTPNALLANGSTGLYCLMGVHTQPRYLDLLGSKRTQNRTYS